MCLFLYLAPVYVPFIIFRKKEFRGCNRTQWRATYECKQRQSRRAAMDNGDGGKQHYRQSEIERILDDPIAAVARQGINLIGNEIYKMTGDSYLMRVASHRICDRDKKYGYDLMPIIDRAFQGIGVWHMYGVTFDRAAIPTDSGIPLHNVEGMNDGLWHDH